MDEAKTATEARHKTARLKTIRENLDGLIIPDCWHAAMQLKNDGLQLFSDDVLECWYIAHDLRDELANLRAQLDEGSRQ